ncbi:MAG TPA: hypothetical protein VHZ78_01400 [Rhizomicrobium sp.]|jgi:hypothetical protein|nr:hypothetical protein [Rhizomicrobium sp.]
MSISHDHFGRRARVQRPSWLPHPLVLALIVSLWALAGAAHLVPRLLP